VCRRTLLAQSYPRIWKRYPVCFKRAIDDGPTKRYGPKVQGAGIHRNPTTTPDGAKFIYGHLWVTISAVVRHKLWATVGLPFLAKMYIRVKDIAKIYVGNFIGENLFCCERTNENLGENKMKGYKKLAISSLLLTLLISGLVWARPVNKTEAEKAVKGWLKIDPKPLNAILGSEIETTDVFSGDDGSPVYYVIYLKPSGFVIMPADDIVEPVVCFVTGDAYYDPSPENPLGAMISQDLPARVDSAQKLQKDWDAGKDLAAEETALGIEAIKAKDKWSKLQKHADSGVVTGLSSVSDVTDVRVAPLVQSKWSQSTCCSGTLACYNYYTPPYAAGSTNNYVCGCVATAMAQFMRYYQWPAADKGIGVYSFTIWVDGSQQTANTRGGDGIGGPYDWTNMVLLPACSTTQAQREAIGALCYDAGVASSMQYAGGGSGAYMHDAKAALLNTFFYTNAIMGGNESTEIGSGRNEMINPDLDASYPVLLAIRKSGVGGGHAVIADGYGYDASTLYHHINMGWAGLADAWYNLPSIYSYNVVSTCIYNVYTSGSGEIISGRVTDSSGQPFSDATVTAQGPGGPYSTTTDSKGIYALEKVNSSSSYTISVTKEGYFFTDKTIVTGTSADRQITSGNKWGVNFAATVPPPQAPTSINYPSSSSTGIYPVNWSLSATATSYQLQRSSNGGRRWSQVYSGPNNSYQENIGNGSYRYRVKATNSAGSSDWTTGTWDCVVSKKPRK